MEIKVTTNFNENIISQEVEMVNNDMRDSLGTKIIELQEKGIREALIKLGWTPPKN